MILRFRAIRKSIHDFTISLFQSPPPATGWSNFNVYGEDELRQATDGTFTPVSPYIFIVDSFIAPTRSTLPLIVIEASVMSDPFQLGDASGRYGVGRFHIFGRTRGERDDIASMLADVFAGTMLSSGSVHPFPIYDYHSGGSSTFIETAQINEGVDIMPMGIGEDETFEGSLMAWNQVSFTFHTKQ